MDDDGLIDPGVNLTDGDGTAADFVQNTGGSASPYAQNQDLFSTLDDGGVFSTAATVVSPTTGQATGTTGSTTTTSPSWLTSIQSLVTGATSTAQQLSPLINGQPSGTPGTTTATAASSSSLLIIVVLAVLAFLFLGRRR